LSPLFSKSAFNYAIWNVDINQEELKLIGTYQLLLYSDYVNLLKTKHNLPDIRNQSVPRRKYFPPRL